MLTLPSLRRRTARCCLALFALASLLHPTSARAEEKIDGAKLYRSKCASCHGAKGEGSKKYKKRLEGDQSIKQLAAVIQQTMPESTPGSLTEAEAEAISAHIHGEFYSTLARERNRPARIDLARLTVRQYRNAVSDLVGSFRWQPTWGTERGLKAEYFKNRRSRPGDRAIQRVDPQVAFDFGTESPEPGKMEAHEFSVRWNGSLLANATGEHELIVRTEHAARLYLNDQRRPLIDAWVKSGNDTEYRATIFLVAGRVYPLRLEYTKAKQGVDDSKKTKKPPPKVKSSIALLWKQPKQVAEVVPSRNLSTAPAPEQFVCSTAFPPDDRSYGWERGTTVSKEWDAATTDAALDAAGYVVARMNELAGTRDDAPDRKKKLQEFCLKFAERAYRAPLSAEQKKSIERQFALGKDNLEASVKRVVLLVLKSPRFLYREVSGEEGPYGVAARLAFGLWGSLPDRALLEAAARNQLATKEQVARQAERMLNDPRARATLRDFLLTWLKADHGLDLGKDPKHFPGFDAQAIADLRTSLELFIDDVVWSDDSDFRKLLLSEEVFLNGRLAKLYGVDGGPEDEKAGFRKVKLDEGKRAGALTHPYLMTSFAHTTESSPIHRGVFLARGVLGVSLRTPPEAVAPLAPDLHPKLTTRERVALQTSPATCMTCHQVINQLGFALENFDAVGRFRDREKGKEVDASGMYRTRDGKDVKVKGARDLAKFLAGSTEAHSAFAEQLFHHLAQQPVRAYGLDNLEGLRRGFEKNNFHVRKLAVEIMTVYALKPRSNTTAAAAKR